MPPKFIIKIAQSTQNVYQQFKKGVTYRNINGAKPVFKEPVSGLELAKIMATSGLTREEVSFTVERALRQMNYNPDANYTPEQLDVFVNGIVEALKAKYSEIVEKMI